MARRCALGKESGYYKQLVDTDIVEMDESDVYEVERLVEKRGLTFYLVLWKDYPKEEACWVRSSDITETAIRLYDDPNPPTRVLLDSISELTTVIQSSLHGGLLKRRVFTIPFPRHVFNFLFKDKGKKVKNKPGRQYERPDFTSPYFNDDNFTYYNKHGEGCFVRFPIYMHSYVKFSLQSYNHQKKPRHRNFTETILVKLIKTRES